MAQRLRTAALGNYFSKFFLCSNLGSGQSDNPHHHSCPSLLLVEAVSPSSEHLSSVLSPLYLQMQYLDSMNGEDLLLTGEVRWRPLVEKNPQSILKPHAPTYNDEGL